MYMSSMDGRKLDHKTREAIRIRAVRRVLAGESPEVVVKALGFSRQRIYEWLARYREGGEEALRFRGIPGRRRKLSDAQMRKLYDIVTNKNPLQLRFRFALWTRGMVRQLILERFGVSLSESQVGRLLKGMGLTAQRPLRRAMERDPERVGRWLREEYPRIRALAREKRATIYFGDEAGVRSDYHSGTTWAPRGKTPVVESTGARFRLNLVSAISSKGQLRFMTTPGRMSAGKFVEFLRRLMHNQRRPVFLILDGHSIHKAKVVRDYVESTKGKLRLFHLPPYSPDLNPGELVWNHLKNHKPGREVIKGQEHMRQRVLSILRSLQRMPAKIISFFKAPKLRYALI